MNKIQPEINPHIVLKKIDKSLSTIDNFDYAKLNEKEKEEIFNQLSDIEKLALELKKRFAD